MRDDGTASTEFDGREVEGLARELGRLISRLEDAEETAASALRNLHPTYRHSARNLLHYLALRRVDIHELQDRLAAVGVSSLDRAESHVMASVLAVLHVLHRLSGRSLPPYVLDCAVPDFDERESLEQHAAMLLGPRPARRRVRIMVTLPSAAGDEYRLVRDLLAHGMDCVRINCAHDDAPTWARMVDNLRRAQRELGKTCRILMDLAGAKLRTGSIGPGPAVLKWSPERDAYGRVVAPARIWLTPGDGADPCPLPDAPCLPVARDWVTSLGAGDEVEFVDARGAHRKLQVVGGSGHSRWAECQQTAYVAPRTVLRAVRRSGAASTYLDGEAATVGALPPRHRPILLRKGDTLILTRDPIPGAPAEYGRDGRLLRPASISCRLPEVFEHVRPGERILIDDGKLAGIVRRVEPDRLHIEVTHPSNKRVKLRADRGINLPDTNFEPPALTNQDIANLRFIVAHADLVGLSFAQRAADVTELQTRLNHLDGARVGIVLKIETYQAFQHLPELLLAAMRSPVAGVMIARGDLAVECGWETLAEIQEEILWICEAAHLPVIWATQVLENLTKTGLPSRAEITDAAMAARAECVLLNKGPHILDSIRMIDDILERMQSHQAKKIPHLSKLPSWSHDPAAAEDPVQPVWETA